MTSLFRIDQLRSWLPVDAVIRDGQPRLEWMDMTGVLFDEPFFDQTVRRIERPSQVISLASQVNTVRDSGGGSASSPGRERVVTDLDALIQLEKISDSLAPSGFILHSSRCGSTLVANACRALEDSLVIAEAPALDKMVSRLFTDAEPGSAKELLYMILVRGVVSALGQRRLGSERHYFVKFACTSTLQFSRIRRIWPKVPCLFLYRHPVEVIVSNLRNIPEWMRSESNPATAAAMLGVELSELADVGPMEFCARALGQFYSAAEAAQDELTWLVDYRQLNADTLAELVRFFGVTPTTTETNAIEALSRLYSKDPTRTVRFSTDSDSKRANASREVVEVAEKWAMAAYRRLDHRR